MKHILLFIIIFFLAIPKVNADEKFFEENKLFPTWDSHEVEGVIGKNTDNKFALDYLPRIINVLLKFVAPILTGMFMFAGIRFVYAGDEEEEIKKSKLIFGYAGFGLILIIFSYSLMKAIYFMFYSSPGG